MDVDTEQIVILRMTNDELEDLRHLVRYCVDDCLAGPDQEVIDRVRLRFRAFDPVD